jgi:hypothetical protein
MRIDRVISLAIGVIAFLIAFRALWLLYALNAGPDNFIPAGASSQVACPPQNMFTISTEQTFVLLLSLLTLAASRLLWRR